MSVEILFWPRQDEGEVVYREAAHGAIGSAVIIHGQAASHTNSAGGATPPGLAVRSSIAQV